MSWFLTGMDSNNPRAHARNKRLALIKRRHEKLLRQQAAKERVAMDARIDELDGILDGP